MTLHDQYVKALEAKGAKRLEAYQGRYTKLTRAILTKDGKPTFYFVGAAGAVRIGRSASTSIPMSDAAKAALLASLTADLDAIVAAI